jgi:cell division protein FtsN
MSRTDSASRPKAVHVRGGRFLNGVLVGLMLGVAISAGVAIYVTHMPSPFLARNAHLDDSAANKPAAEMPEISRHGLINPSPTQPENASAPVTQPQEQPAAPSDQMVAPVPPVTSEPTRAPEAAQAPTTYFIQTGAFQKEAEADNQRATLALLGIDATILSPEAGDKQPLYRVRIGPMVSVDEVRTVTATLKNSGISTTLIKVKPKSAVTH